MDTKYGGKLTVTTKTSLNEVPNGGWITITSGSTETAYGTVYTYTYASGSGEICRSTDSKYNGSLVITTVTSLNAVPEGDGALVASGLSQTDYGTIYTYTYAEGEGQIGISTDNKYGGTLTLTTITSLNTVP